MVRRYSKRKLFTWWTGACAALAISPVFAQPGAQAPNAPQATILSDDTGDQLPAGAEVLVSGPLHEAFAEQFTNVPTPGLIVTKEPPTAIDELPPEYRPDGYDIVWIPGYWGWDQDRDDFVWITGVWRESPPDRVWIPGYWSQVTEGFQWTSGFWAANSSTEIEYLPPPPEPLTAEPSSEPPAADQFWIPGQWNYVNNSYQWRAGYWTVAYPDWVWVPDRYVWTPGGYIYRVGYWDYLLPERGTIFCPIYYSQPVQNYRFQPTYIVDSGPNLLANLFVNPTYNHYYFGNYYSSQYLGRSIYPWVTFTQQSRLYDPMYGYYRTQYRDSDYLTRIARMHTYYASNPQFQPARTLTLQQQNINLTRGDLGLQALRLSSLLDDRDSPWSLVRLANTERSQLQRGLNPANELRKLRADMETGHRDRFANYDRDGSRIPDRDGNRNADGRNPRPNESADTRPGQPRSRDDNRWKLPTKTLGDRLGSVAVGSDNRQRNQNSDDDSKGRTNAERSRNESANTLPNITANGSSPGDQTNNSPSTKFDRADRNNTDRNNTDRNNTDRNNPNRSDANRGDAGRAGNLGRTDSRTQPGAGDRGRPDANRPDTNKPDVNRPDINRPSDLPRDARSGTDPVPPAAVPNVGRPNADRPDGVRPNVGAPNAGAPNAGAPNAGAPNPATPNNGQPNSNLPNGDRTKTEVPKSETPNTARPNIGRPNVDRPNINRPNADRPNVERPSVERPKVERPNRGPESGRVPNAADPVGPAKPTNPLNPAASGVQGIQDDLRQMRELSQRQAQRRREAGNNPRATPRPPVIKPPATSPSAAGQPANSPPVVRQPAVKPPEAKPPTAVKPPANNIQPPANSNGRGKDNGNRGGNREKGDNGKRDK